MKNRNILLLLVLSVGLISCSKENDANFKKIVIKGTLSGSTLKSANSPDSEKSYTLADAKKVLLFNSSGGYEIFTINNNTIVASAMPGTATAMAFLSDDNSYIGCLQSSGLNVLPLVSLKDGDETVIDLGALRLEGRYVIPDNDPIGTLIDLDPDEIERYHQFGSFFESLSQNIDADQDGKADLIDKKALYVSTIFDISCGSWGLNESSPQITDTSLFTVDYTLRVWGDKALLPTSETVSLSGPEASPYPSIIQSHYAIAPDGFIAFFRRESNPPPSDGSSLLPFENGTYTLNLDDKNYSLHYSNIDVKYFLVLAVPTLHTNDQDEIVSITVDYVDASGTPVNPENFVYQTAVVLSGINNNQFEQIGALWESPEAKTNTELFTFVPDIKIQASELTHVIVSYIDLVGNTYNIGFNN